MASYLDRSARPLALLVRDFWRILFPEISPPKTRFLNIGKETSQDGVDSAAGIGDNYSISTHGKILVVDEFIMHGTSLRKAKILLEKTFPDREILTMTPSLHLFKELPSVFKGVEDSTDPSSMFTAKLDSDPGSTKAKKLLRSFLKRYVESHKSDITEIARRLQNIQN